MDFDIVSVHKNAKKGLSQYPAILTKQAWLITHICCNISVSAKLFRVLKITWVSRDCPGYKMDRTGELSEELKATKEVQKIVDEVCLELVTISKRGT